MYKRNILILQDLHVAHQLGLRMICVEYVVGEEVRFACKICVGDVFLGQSSTAEIASDLQLAIRERNCHLEAIR